MALLLGEAAAQAAPPPGASTQVQGQNTRESISPAIGFIDSPNAYCHQPDPYQDVCYINWYYLSVDAAPNYMVQMTLELDGKFVARNQGFFQTSMYIPHDMNGLGYKVRCGSLGSGGDPNWGATHSFTIRAKDSAGLSSTNYGTAYCPAYIPPTTR